MKIVSKFHVPILYTFREISRQRALWSGRTGSASPKMVIQIYYDFFRVFFIKVLEQF